MVKEALNDLTRALGNNGNNRGGNSNTEDDLIAHVEARLIEVVNHSN
jgi:hypothetical protein